MSRVDILLATCDGEKFIGEQIESLLAQSYPNIRILIRDDASQDGTPDIIQKYVQDYPKKIHLYQSSIRQGVKENFSRLMDLSTAPYIMFSDQDDCWMPKKVEHTFCQMQAMERQYGEHPLLVHTDLVVVDEHLTVIHPSFWSYTHLHPQPEEKLNFLLSQNVVTGCAMMINRLSLELAKPIPDEAYMHDWWIALATSAFGKVGILKEPSLYYRQHDRNALGAKKFGSFENLKHNFQKLRKKEVRKHQQAQVFFHRYHALFDPMQRKMLKAFLNLPRASWLKKRYDICKYRFFKQGFLRNVADFVLG